MRQESRVRPFSAMKAGLRAGLFFGGFMTVMFWVMEGWGREVDWVPLLGSGLVTGTLAGVMFGVCMGRMMRPKSHALHVDNAEDFHLRLVAAASKIKYQLQERSADGLVFRPAWFLGLLSSPIVVDLAPGQATLVGPRPMVQSLLEDLG